MKSPETIERKLSFGALLDELEDDVSVEKDLDKYTPRANLISEVNLLKRESTSLIIEANRKQ